MKSNLRDFVVIAIGVLWFALVVAGSIALFVLPGELARLFRD